MNKHKQLSAWLHRLSTGRVALIATVVFVLFTASVLPWQAAEAARVSGGAGSPDTSLWYTPADLYAMAEAYGPEGRQAYLVARWTFDVIWPLVYTAFLVAATSWLLRRVLSAASAWQQLNLLPVLAMILDFLENSAASIVLARYPTPSPLIAPLAPVFTLLKWLLVGGSFVLLLGLALAALWQQLQQRQTKRPDK